MRRVEGRLEDRMVSATGSITPRDLKCLLSTARRLDGTWWHLDGEPDPDVAGRELKKGSEVLRSRVEEEPGISASASSEERGQRDVNTSCHAG